MVTIARLTCDCSPTVPLKALTLPLRRCVLTLLTLTSNSFSTASLICGLVAFLATLNITWLRSEASVAFLVLTDDFITTEWWGYLVATHVSIHWSYYHVF